jgi:hypothetical protein
MKLSEKKKALNDKVNVFNNGGGFGDPDAALQHHMEIEQLRFEIAQSDKYRIGIIGAFIGALVALCGSFLLEIIGQIPCFH